MSADMSADAITAALVEPGGSDTGETSSALIDAEIAKRAQALSTREAGAVYARWRTHPAAKQGWAEPVWGTPDDEKLLADLRGVEFWALAATAARLSALSAAAEALREAVDAVGTGLYDAWDEAVATAATGRFGRYASGVRSWQDGVTRLAVGLEGAGEVVSGVLRAWADDARSVDLRMDDLALRQTQVDRVDAALGDGSLWGRTFVPDELRSAGVCDLNARSAPPWPSHDVMAWLDEFCARYDALVGRFRGGLRAAHDAVSAAWQVLGEVAGEVVDEPFAGAVSGPPVTGGDRVVIRDGERTITLVGPDSQGRYGLTVDGERRVLELGDGSDEVRVGETVIRAEQLGPGRVQVTVDDGVGEPEKYTIESEGGAVAEARDGAVSTPSEAGSGGAGSGGAGSAGAGSAGAGSGGVGGVGGGPGAGATAAAPLGDGPMTGAQEMGDGKKAGGVPVAAAAAGEGSGGRGGMMGGGMMGGGMGGGGQGGDSERKTGQWRIQGSLFDGVDDPAAGFDGIIGAPAPRG
ncbi:hypothetical protein ACFPM7_03545 [Actinokineospora guangxiensis]|uniref:WXG100 family type VII secretion target n=1 Tax=Actinokineospora guangxiensis TaxID=1490288 RepID=A0ABW0EIK5_9PSEU